MARRTSSFKKLLENGLVWCPEEARYAEDALTSERAFYATAHTTARFGIESIDSTLPHAGLSSSNIHEFFFGSLEPINYLPAPPLGIISNIVVNHLRESESHTLWIGKTCWPSPFALQSLDPTQHTVLSRCIFINPPHRKHCLWATETALRDGSIAIVISALNALSFTATRRLSLAATRGKSIGILLRNIKEQHTPSSARTRWLIKSIRSPQVNPQYAHTLYPYPKWHVTLLSCKGPQPSINNWIIQYKDQQYIEAEQNPVAHLIPTQKKYAAA